MNTFLIALTTISVLLSGFFFVLFIINGGAKPLIGSVLLGLVAGGSYYMNMNAPEEIKDMEEFNEIPIEFVTDEVLEFGPDFHRDEVPDWCDGESILMYWKISREIAESGDPKMMRFMESAAKSSNGFDGIDCSMMIQHRTEADERLAAKQSTGSREKATQQIIEDVQYGPK